MLKAVKNTWTVLVNLGWLAVLGVYVAPQVIDRMQAPAVQASPVHREVKPPVATAVEPAAPVPAVQPVAWQAPAAAEEPPPAVAPPRVQKTDAPARLNPQPDPEPEPEPTGPAYVSPPRDFPPSFAGQPATLCEGGTCRIDSRYKYVASEPRTGPEPRIYFPQPPLPPGIPPGETYESSRARYDNDEQRWNLNELKARLRWTPRIYKLLDLSQMGACPWDTRRVLQQNAELHWRVRQLTLIIQGYEPEGLEYTASK